MKQCHRFLHSWLDIQNWSKAQNSWEWNLWTPHASKLQIEVVSWFHTNDGSVHSLNQGSLDYQMLIIFVILKNMWSISYIEIRVTSISFSLWMTSIWPTKEWPNISDPDSPGHSTHSQPWVPDIKVKSSNVLKYILVCSKKIYGVKKALCFAGRVVTWWVARNTCMQRWMKLKEPDLAACCSSILYSLKETTTINSLINVRHFS